MLDNNLSLYGPTLKLNYNTHTHIYTGFGGDAYDTNADTFMHISSAINCLVFQLRGCWFDYSFYQCVGNTDDHS